MDKHLEHIATKVVDCTMKIHMALGSGLLESGYTILLEKKIRDQGFDVKRQVPVLFVFEGVTFQMGFRADLIINECFLVELKDGNRRVVN